MSEGLDALARQLYEAHHNAGPVANELIEWGRGGYKTQVATWHAVARAALSVLEPRIEQLEREMAEARAELERRARNENRNCLNWGPCSAHDGRMAIAAAIRNGEAEQ